MIKIGQRNFVLTCPLNCKGKHTENQVAVLINQNLEEEFEGQNEQEQIYQEYIQNDEESLTSYSISLNNNICKNKLQVLLRIINNQQNGIYLQIEDIDSKNISQAYEILKGDKIKGLKVIFIQLFQKYKQADVHKFFNMVQDLKNLESLQYYNQDNIFQNNPTRMKIPLLQATKNGSLSKLKHLSINSTLMQMNNQTLQNLEKALISQNGESHLVNFTLNTVECELDRKSFRSISNILYYNRQTLQNIDIKIAESDFDTDNPLNELGKTIEEMTDLRSIQLQLNLIQSDFEQINTNLSKFFNGIYRCKSESLSSVTIVLLNIFIMSCSNVGQSLSRIPSISYFGTITLPQAVEMGIALGKSSQLTNFKVFSKSDEMALMLSYLFHFSKTLKNVQVDYQGKRLQAYKEIQAGLAANQSIEEIQISSSDQSASDVKGLYHISKGIQRNNTIKKLTINYDSKGDIELFHNFFENISENQTLEQLSIDFIQANNVQQQFDAQRIATNICKLTNLQAFEMNFNPLTKMKIKQKIQFIQLLHGLINHPYAFNFCLNEQFNDIQIISDNLYSQCENLMLKLIAFNKIVSPLLDYHPTRHIEDLFFQ